LIVLFLDTLQQSALRVANRSLRQAGIEISGNNIKINFNESFKNVANYFLYFDQSEFIYTGLTGENKFVMSFSKSQLTNYVGTDLQYPQKFANYSFQKERLGEESYNMIQKNEDYQLGSESLKETRSRFRR